MTRLASERALGVVVALLVALGLIAFSRTACADSRWVVVQLLPSPAGEPWSTIEVFWRKPGEQTWIFARSSPVKGYLHVTDCAAGCARTSLQVFVPGVIGGTEVAARLTTAERASDLSNAMPFEATYRTSRMNVERVCNAADNDDNGLPGLWQDRKLCEWALQGILR